MKMIYGFVKGRMRILQCLLLLVTIANSATAAPLNPGKLTCEYIDNPLGIDIAAPRLSWTVISELRNQKQTAYELIVSDNLKDIEAVKGNKWTTGKITSSQSLHITYAGAPLQPFTRYYWRIRVYNQDGAASA